MFQRMVGSGRDSLCEPIRHLQRGVEIHIVAPKVPACLAADALVPIDCADLIEVSSYSRHFNGDVIWSVGVSSMLLKVLTTLLADIPSLQTRCYLEASLKLNSTFVQLRQRTEVVIGFTTTSAQFVW